MIETAASVFLIASHVAIGLFIYKVAMSFVDRFFERISIAAAERHIADYEKSLRAILKGTSWDREDIVSERVSEFRKKVYATINKEDASNG